MSSMSNAQTQTRGLSAGDWVRLKRLLGARTYQTVNLDTDKDIIPTTQTQLPYHLPIHSYKVVGTSKIRRTASAWTDYRASQTADYVLPRVFQGVSPSTNAKLGVTRLCDCSTEPLETKLAGCSKCKYDPIENFTPQSGLIFEQIILNSEYNGSLTGQHMCPIPDDITPYVKLYKITLDTTQLYNFNLICNTGDQDLYLSYINTPITLEGVQAAMINRYGCGSTDLATYFASYSDNGGSDIITRSCNTGETVYILILSFDPGNYTFSVVPTPP